MLSRWTCYKSGNLEGVLQDCKRRIMDVQQRRTAGKHLLC